MHAQPFTPVLIGTSPAGVEWVARRPQDVETMRTRLAELHRRHATKQTAKTRRVKLTPAQHDLVERFLAEDSTATLRKTYVETHEDELCELAALVEGETSDAMENAASESLSARTDQEVAFAAIQGGLSCMVLAAKLRGKRLDKVRARRELARMWG